jgi:hypothetical protein
MGRCWTGRTVAKEPLVAAPFPSCWPNRRRALHDSVPFVRATRRADPSCCRRPVGTETHRRPAVKRSFGARKLKAGKPPGRNSLERRREAQQGHSRCQPLAKPCCAWGTYPFETCLKSHAHAGSHSAPSTVLQVQPICSVSSLLLCTVLRALALAGQGLQLWSLKLVYRQFHLPRNIWDVLQ